LKICDIMVVANTSRPNWTAFPFRRHDPVTGERDATTRTTASERGERNHPKFGGHAEFSLLFPGVSAFIQEGSANEEYCMDSVSLSTHSGAFYIASSIAKKRRWKG
jgi:hypothetical protein